MSELIKDEITYIVEPPPVSVDCYPTPLLNAATVFGAFFEGHFKGLLTGVGPLLLTSDHGKGHKGRQQEN